jgi:hypothetical protein
MDMKLDKKLVATVMAYAAIYFASVVLLRLLPPEREYTVTVIFVLSSLPPWSLFLTWPWRAHRAGPVRLELGRPGGSYAFRLGLVLLFLVPLVIASAIAVLSTETVGQTSLPVATMASVGFAFTMIGYFLLLRFGRLQLRQVGVAHFPWVIRWSQIESFQVYRDFFELQLQSSWELPKTVDWEVRGIKKRMLAQILAQHVAPPPVEVVMLSVPPEDVEPPGGQQAG